ncbi:MAG: hypothetical protein QOI01_5735 [Mycobacterium sp.]|nr:hypothetical protein [Mycobacterium sp.]
MDGLVRHDCQRPAPARQLPGDCHIGKPWSVSAGIEADPAGVQAPVGGLTRARAAGEARSHQRRSSAPGRYRLRWCQAASTSAANVSVAGLGHPTPRLVPKNTRWEQPDVGTDGAPGQSMSFADPHRQPERRQGGDAADTPQPVTTGVNSPSAAGFVIA